jgi:hypothetical protein
MRASSLRVPTSLIQSMHNSTNLKKNWGKYLIAAAAQKVLTRIGS